MAVARRFDPGRRAFLRTAGAAGLTLASGSLLGGCGSAGSSSDPIRLGYVSPETGPLSVFGEADRFVIDAMTAHFARNPVQVGGSRHPVEIVKRDSQSSPDRAADVAADLIRNGGIHMMLVSSTPDTANPVSDQCEAGEMPCVSTVIPWQPWFFGRGGEQGKPFRWTFNFFYGIEDFEAVYGDMWDSLPTNKVVGGLWPTDPDGLAWGHPTTGFPAFIEKRGYTSVNPGHFPAGTKNFADHIAAFKAADVQILTGVPAPEDFNAFWRQASAQGFRPKIVTIAKAIEYPQAVGTLGPALADKIGTEIWWSPYHPFSSSLTGQSSKAVADAYTAATGKQWTMPIGYAHALFEVAVKAFSGVSDITDRDGLAAAIGKMKIDTLVGPLDWTRGPMPGVAKAPMVGGQWRATTGATFPFDILVVNNKQAPAIPTNGTLVSL